MNSLDDMLTCLKVVIVGDGAVGKTSLLISYSQGRFPTEYVPTVFDNFEKVIKVNNEEFLMQLWDTAGQEEYDHLRPISYPETDVFLLCFSLAGDRSLTDVQKKWMPEVQKHCPGVPFILVGTKHDLKDEVSLGRSTEELHELAEEMGAVGFVECSSKEMFNVDKVFELAADTCLRDPSKLAALRSPANSLSKKASSPDLRSNAGEGGCCVIL